MDGINVDDCRCMRVCLVSGSFTGGSGPKCTARGGSTVFSEGLQTLCNDVKVRHSTGSAGAVKPSGLGV